jgi:hypothetical protein
MTNNHFVSQFRVRSDVRSGAAEQVNQGGGYVNGVWYADKSGVCGGTVPPYPPYPPYPPTPPIPPQTGGWVNGVWYGDRSGACG